MCKVAGCEADLRLEKPRNLLVKICDHHQRASQVVVNGEASRYCQQCSCFHGLKNFEIQLRSCRESLQRRRNRFVAPLSSRHRQCAAYGNGGSCSKPTPNQICMSWHLPTCLPQRFLSSGMFCHRRNESCGMPFRSKGDRRRRDLETPSEPTKSDADVEASSSPKEKDPVMESSSEHNDKVSCRAQARGLRNPPKMGSVNSLCECTAVGRFGFASCHVPRFSFPP